MTTKYIPAKEVAQIIRGELKVAFPGHKFSVTTQHASAISIKWVDGPAIDQVKALTNQYKGSSFDAMQDLKEYVRGEYQGEMVQFGSDYIFVTRSYSKARVETVIDQVKAQFGEMAKDAHVAGSETFGFCLAGVNDFWAHDTAMKLLQGYTEFPQEEPAQAATGPRVPTRLTALATATSLGDHYRK